MLDVLLVDDEPLIRLSIGDALRASDYAVTLAADGAEAVKILEQSQFDVVITDIRLPKVNGMDIFRLVKSQSPDTEVILITAFGAVADAVSAFKAGAHDYLTKPFDADELIMRLERIGEVKVLRRRLAEADSALAGDRGRKTRIIGQSGPMRQMFDRLNAFAGSEASVLITGESGTGKELVAKALHEGSTRFEQPFVAVNCAAFPETLLEAELFGHERGAFTGATRRREGRFQAAHNGTLFLDEVAEMPLPAQAKLLRVLQERAVEPLGTNKAVKVDVRILSATHRNLAEYIANGRFREDLFYRLNVLQLDIPPLRERKADLPLLVEYFLNQLAPGDSPTISDRALMALYHYAFPGNVRELEHAIHHGVVLARDGTIELSHLPSAVAEVASSDQVASTPLLDLPNSQIEPLATALKSFERDYLIRALKRTSGKRTAAAEILGISRKNLWEKMLKLEISEDDFKREP